MTIRWFLSKRIRHATDMCHHVRKLLAAQRDILAPQAIADVTAAISETEKAIDANVDEPTLNTRVEEMEKVANARLKPYPSPEWRENIEVLLVAIAVAMAIRTFFLQPFKIPTSSMQPTLYGVTTDNLADKPDVKLPGLGQRIVDACVHGVFYHEIVAPDDCELVDLRQQQVARFISKHVIYIKSTRTGEMLKPITHWFSTDERLASWAGLHPGQQFKKGEYIVRLKEVTGDHLFVDRVTYNFRHPKRGEIIVFKTKGIPQIPNQNQFYIKRLVGLPGERISIGEDHHVRINGARLDANTPGFSNVYSGPDHPVENGYGGYSFMGPYLPSADAVYPIRTKHYFALGDNTLVSADSRAWGDLPQENVIGKGFFVYWPISNRGGSRFGLGYQ